MGDKGDVLAQMLSQDTCIQFIVQPSDLVTTFVGDDEHVRAAVHNIRHRNRRSNDERDRPMPEAHPRDLLCDLAR